MSFSMCLEMKNDDTVTSSSMNIANMFLSETNRRIMQACTMTPISSTAYRIIITLNTS